MPRGFTDTERELIRQRLIAAGREIFGQYGMKKTSIEDLTEKCGISKGAFYQFFPSKEDLYFAVLRDYETRQQQSMYRLLSSQGDDQKVQFKSVIKSILGEVDSDPFLRRILDGSEKEHLWQKFTAEQLDLALQSDVDFASKLVEAWKEMGKLKEEDPRVVSGVLRGIFFLYLHKQDIGEEVFPQVVDLLLDAAIDALVEG